MSDEGAGDHIEGVFEEGGEGAERGIHAEALRAFDAHEEEYDLADEVFAHLAVGIGGQEGERGGAVAHAAGEPAPNERAGDHAAGEAGQGDGAPAPVDGEVFVGDIAPGGVEFPNDDAGDGDEEGDFEPEKEALVHGVTLPRRAAYFGEWPTTA